MVWADVSKLNRDRTEQSLNITELEQNRSSYMVWAGVSKQNRVRTEKVELHGLAAMIIPPLNLTVRNVVCIMSTAQNLGGVTPRPYQTSRLSLQCQSGA